MIVYLAGFKTIYKHWKEPTKDIYLLSSFYEHKSGKFGDYVYQDRHMLDSGAFSAMNGTTKNIDWNKYVERYINFIKYTEQNYFIELDLDYVVGLNKVRDYRHKIEDKVGKPCIPVWHYCRGKQNWIDLCKEYDFVSFGAFMTDNLTYKAIYKYLPWFLQVAKKYNTKVHGLGFTKATKLKKYKFYSVDSTTWNVGAKYGNVVMLKNGLPTQRYKKNNHRVDDVISLNIYNFKQWIKFQKYAKKYL